MPDLTLRRDVLDKAMRDAGIGNKYQLAKATGLYQSTCGRILSGKDGAGRKSIAGLLVAFPNLDTRDLFDIVAIEEKVA